MDRPQSAPLFWGGAIHPTRELCSRASDLPRPSPTCTRQGRRGDERMTMANPERWPRNRASWGSNECRLQTLPILLVAHPRCRNRVGLASLDPRDCSTLSTARRASRFAGIAVSSAERPYYRKTQANDEQYQDWACGEIRPFARTLLSQHHRMNHKPQANKCSNGVHASAEVVDSISCPHGTRSPGGWTVPGASRGSTGAWMPIGPVTTTRERLEGRERARRPPLRRSRIRP